MFYAFKDNEAVIKMIIKGRSPTMRHVSRTHRVALDWLFDRINLDSKIQIRYIDTKHQLADILTNGTIFFIFSTSAISALLAAPRIPSILTSCTQNDGGKDAGAKRRRKKWGNIEIYSDEPVFSCTDKFLNREKSNCIPKVRGILIATGKAG